jgi:hypothetical protein
MARGLTSGLSTALDSTSVRPVLLVEMEFSGSTLRISDQDRNISWNSQTWLGNGLLRPIQNIDESAELRGTGAQITLSGADSALLATVLTGSQQSKKGRIWLGALDSSFSIIADPYKVFEGFLDVPEITDSGKGSTIILTYESELTILDRASEIRFTDETQQSFYPGDKGFNFINQAARARPFWGKPSPPPPVARRKVVEAKPKGSKGKK